MMKQGSLDKSDFRITKKRTTAKIQKLDLKSSDSKKILKKDHGKKQDDVDADQNQSVQSFVHKAVSYDRAGFKELPLNKFKVYEFVKDNFSIPENFEKDHKFGPLSGVSFEERVIDAYMQNLLEPQSRDDSFIEDDSGKNILLKMCFTCGNFGHWPKSCPEGF